MGEITDIATLTTTAGAAIVAGIAVQVGKAIVDGSRRTWRITALISAVLSVVGGYWLGGTLTPTTAVLGVLNGCIAALAAMATYDLSQERSTTTPIPPALLDG